METSEKRTTLVASEKRAALEAELEAARTEMLAAPPNTARALNTYRDFCDARCKLAEFDRLAWLAWLGERS